MESMVNIGGVGLGELGEKLVTAASRNDQLNVVAGADLKFADDRFSDAFETEFTGANAYESYETMLDDTDLDAVIVATPHTVHHEQVIDSIRDGLDVFVEKPMVTDIDNALELYETAETHDAVVQVGYPRHHHPGYQQMRELVDDGAVGRIDSVQGYLEQPGWINHADGTWRTNPGLSGGGQLYDTGQHLLDSILFTTNAVPQSVTDAATTSAGYDVAVDVDSTLTAELRRNGEVDTFTADIAVYGSPQNDDPSSAYPPETIYESLVISGDDGEIRYEDGKLLADTAADELAVFPYDTDFDTLIQDEIDQFAAAVHDDDAHIATIEDGLYPILMAEGAYDAAESMEATDVSAYSLNEQCAEVYADD